jgi:hypothetical protein
MKNLSKYIQESIFDIDDNIDKVEDEIIFRDWLNKFQNTSNFEKTYSDFLKDIIKRGGKHITSNTLKGDEIFCRCQINKPTDYYQWFITFYWPVTSKYWKQVSIGMAGKTGVRFTYPDKTLLDKSSICNRIGTEDIVSLPKIYLKLIDLICEGSK